MKWEKVKLSEVTEYITDGDHQPAPKSDSGVLFVRSKTYKIIALLLIMLFLYRKNTIIGCPKTERQNMAIRCTL